MKKRTILSVAGLVGSVTVLSYTIKRNKKNEPARPKEEDRPEVDFDPEICEHEPEKTVKSLDPKRMSWS